MMNNVKGDKEVLCLLLNFPGKLGKYFDLGEISLLHEQWGEIRGLHPLREQRNSRRLWYYNAYSSFFEIISKK